jgi:hypothetical protein
MPKFVRLRVRLAALTTIAVTTGALIAVVLPASEASAAVIASRSNDAPSSDSNGYDWVSYFRGMAGLGGVTRNPTVQAQEAAHVRYLANHALSCETNVHDELTARKGSCGANRYATAAGKAAANNSDITRVSAMVSDRTAVSNWFTSAFHALTLLDPRLTSTGYAAYYTAHPTGAKPLAWQYTAGVDVYRGRAGQYGGQTVAFPGNGAATPLLSYTVGTESPEPFQTSTGSCRSWGSKSLVSAPIILQRPLHSTASFNGGSIIDLTTGKALTTCTLTASSYPTSALGHQFLAGANGITRAALYFADKPFGAGHKYELKVAGAVTTSFYATALPAAATAVATAAKQSAIVSWPAVESGSGKVHFYTVRTYTAAHCTGALAATIRTKSLRVSVLGLKSGQEHTIKVTATNTVGGGRAGNCTSVRVR